MKKSINVSEVVDLLNEINQIDPSVLPQLVKSRMRCNTSLAEHETVQVGEFEDANGKFNAVGFLGILNGFFGIDNEGWGPIMAHFSESGETILRFTLTENWK